MKQHHLALIAVGIFAAAVLGYFWFKSQVSSAYTQGVQDEDTVIGLGLSPTYNVQL